MISELDKKIRGAWRSVASKSSSAAKATKTASKAEADHVKDFFIKYSHAEAAYSAARLSFVRAGQKLRTSEKQFGTHSLLSHLARQESLEARRAFCASASQLCAAKLSL